MLENISSPPEESIEDVAQKQNYYVSHLADVNKNTDVVSTENIYNNKGALVVPKGVAINENVAQKVLKHKLEKPLEEQVQLSNSLDRNAILEDSKKLFASYKDLEQIHQRNNFEQPFADLVISSNLDPILIQKLTVLQKQLPKDYQKALFSGWLSALIAHEKGLEEALVTAAFIAGLMHDIGLLNVSPAILNKRGELTGDEWRAIQSHVVVSKFILLNIGTLHPEVPRAVLEHHERCDGSGYPAGKTEEELSVMGQIVAMADSMQAIRINQFQPLGRNLRDALPYLHMNSKAHFYDVYAVMCSILKKSGLEPSNVNPFDTPKELVHHLMQRGIKLKKSLSILDPLTRMVEGLKRKPCFRKLAKIAFPVQKMINSSGILDDEILKWLKTLKDSPPDKILPDFCELELMQNELYWQLKKLEKALHSFLDNDYKLSYDQRRALETFAAEMAAILAY